MEHYKGLVEIIPGRLYYTSNASAKRARTDHWFSIDNQLVYWNFFLDFGPLNLGQLYRFCKILNGKLQDEDSGKRIVFYSDSIPQRVTNAVCLLVCWRVLYQNLKPAEAFRPFQNCSFMPFHDATPTECTYSLTILNCASGLAKARDCGFFDFKDFDADEFEYYERVENADLHFVCKKFIAFAGPHSEAYSSPEGYVNHTPENYIDYFKKNHVSMVIRLNNVYYDSARFTTHGIEHRELFFPDGSCPPTDILKQFLQECENTPGVIAVHCKAGLGRTGSLIGAYLMKHYRFTAAETIGWLRTCRPGMVIGPQQHWLESMEQALWKMGEVYERKGVAHPDDDLKTLRLMYGKPTAADLSFNLEQLKISRRKESKVNQKRPLSLTIEGNDADGSQGDALRLAKSSPKAKDAGTYGFSSPSPPASPNRSRMEQGVR